MGKDSRSVPVSMDVMEEDNRIWLMFRLSTQLKQLKEKESRSVPVSMDVMKEEICLRRAKMMHRTSLLFEAEEERKKKGIASGLERTSGNDATRSLTGSRPKLDAKLHVELKIASKHHLLKGRSFIAINVGSTLEQLLHAVCLVLRVPTLIYVSTPRIPSVLFFRKRQTERNRLKMVCFSLKTRKGAKKRLTLITFVFSLERSANPQELKTGSYFLSR